MRRNELRFLTWDDLDLSKGKIYIRPKQVSPDFYFRVKNKEIRDIPIAPELMPILKSLPHKSDRWVFVNSKGNTFSVNPIRTAFRKICRVAGVPVKKQHMTRHTWASQSSQQGVPLDVIQKIGGWRNPKTMDRYKHLADSYMDKIFKDKFSLENKSEK
jgi:integrase